LSERYLEENGTTSNPIRAATNELVFTEFVIQNFINGLSNSYIVGILSTFVTYEKEGQ
jgi:superfamily II RNA helicase